MRIAALLLLGALAGCGIDSSPEASADIKQETRIFRARLEIPRLITMIEHYQARNGEWPESWEDLDKRPIDPWDSPYEFEIQDGKPVVHSLGPDGKPGTGDEIYVYSR